MPFALPPRRALIEVAETLAVALAGAATFAFLKLPAGLVSGSVVAVAAAALMGRPMKVPLALARVCYVVVGILLGTVVTPQTLSGVATWPASIAPDGMLGPISCSRSGLGFSSNATICPERSKRKMCHPSGTFSEMS